jgi:hypothetical protein
MVRDYETPTVPPAWDTYARRWVTRLGRGSKQLSLICSPDRYGIPIVLRVLAGDGRVFTSTRRGSDADNAAERRANFLEVVRGDGYQTIELDVAGYYVGEGIVDCGLCGNKPPHEEWQHVVLRELLKVAEPASDPAGSLDPDDADDAERASLDRRVVELLASA